MSISVRTVLIWTYIYLLLSDGFSHELHHKAQLSPVDVSVTILKRENVEIWSRSTPMLTISNTLKASPISSSLFCSLIFSFIIWRNSMMSSVPVPSLSALAIISWKCETFSSLIFWILRDDDIVPSWHFPLPISSASSKEYLTCISASVGLCPMCRSILPRSLPLMFPSLSVSNLLKALENFFIWVSVRAWW